ncbi:Predicted arabinose efflux permease, MFS family [Hymenobacter gelipurpurascens]|uniref:Predicted arabinose efflux permease, MFS family n=1 Tax=Hymenobacter gelipurpurascens TaxID=89968 RepID=A0A212UEV4_9BACT|nr:MFS transporter [Hymenobacter gelipurpurascens]SNC76661.1 Predicted arabinose efflux permease, MFS family [Hymenobacter gelipurpurascens]
MVSSPSPAVPTPEVRPTLWSPFTYSVFRAIWIASVVSNIGTWMQNVAGVWLVTTLTTSALLVALMQTATSLPAFLLSMPAGAMADLIDRRRLLLFTQGFMAVVALLLGGLTLLGEISAFGVLALTFVLGIGAAINAPVWQTVTVELVPRQILGSAITLNGVSNNIARAIGPAIGGAIIAYYSPGWVFLLNAVSFLGTFAVIYAWQRTADAPTGPAENFTGALRAGMRYVQYSPAIYAVLFRTFAFSFGASAMWGLLSVVIARRLHLSSGSYGVMLSWLGAGAIAGAFLMGRAGNRLNFNQRVLLGSLVFVGTNVALALAPSVYWLYPVMFLTGIAWLMTMTSFSTTVQLNVPKWVQARVVSVYMLVFQAGLSFGSVVWGELADRTTLQVALLATAAWMLLSMLLAVPFPMRSGENLNLEPADHWPTPTVEGSIDPDDGPVVVMIEYEVALPDQPAFHLAAQQLTRLRLRDGSLRAGVFTDVAHATRITEFFYVATWGEHQRQHHRFTKEDLAIEAQVLQFHAGPEPPRVTHFLAFPKSINIEVPTTYGAMESPQ